MRRYLAIVISAALTLLVLLAASASAANPSLATPPALFVAHKGNDSNDCSTLETPCRTVQAAIAKAQPDGMIWVAAGLYPEHLTIDKALSITGAGLDATIIDGALLQRVITVTATANAHLADLTIQHGATTHSGGGILNDGLLSISGCRVVDNRATDYGGGIANGGTLIVDNCEISGNWVDKYDGGGILNAGRATITDSFISMNRCEHYGGGIMNYETLSVSSSTIDGNVTGAMGSGGGIFGVGAFNPATTTLVNVLVSNNQAVGGAGIGSVVATLTITNSTIAFNQGDGISLGGGGPVTYHNTIIAGNTRQNCAYTSGSNVTSNGYNLDSGDSCGFSAGQHDLENADPLLGAWQHARGKVWTRPLLPGSPAIDKGTNEGCPTSDMVGLSRPVDGDGDGATVCDIGAFEYVPLRAYLPLIALRSQPTSSEPPGTLTADSTILQPGWCTTLRWSTRDAQAVYLNGDGVIGYGSIVVCPEQTTTYTLRVVLAGQGCPLSCLIDFHTQVIVNVVPPPVADAEKAVSVATAYMHQAAGGAAVERAQVEVVPKLNGWAVIFRDAYARCTEGSRWPGACAGPFPTPVPPLAYRDVYACVNGLSLLVDGAGGSISVPVDAAQVCLQ